MATRKPKRSLGRTRQTRAPNNNNRTAAPVRKISRPPLTEPFHVAVDRQLKSGHETYEAAEKAALAIKKRYPQLQVTVFDAREQRHTIIDRPKLAAAANTNRIAKKATRSPAGPRKVAVARGKRRSTARC